DDRIAMRGPRRKIGRQRDCLLGPKKRTKRRQHSMYAMGQQPTSARPPGKIYPLPGREMKGVAGDFHRLDHKMMMPMTIGASPKAIATQNFGSWRISKISSMLRKDSGT
ncbi:hypothetical protein, partial [Bradyrhizobium sp. P5_C11_2]